MKNRLNKSLSMLLITFLCGCSSMNFEYSGSDRGFQAAKKAAKEWNDTCHTNLHVERSFWFRHPIIIEERSKFLYGDGTPIDGANSKQAITVHDPSDKPIAIVILSSLMSDQMQTLLAHEMGHIIGINYHTEKGLMMETIDEDPNDQIVTQRECNVLRWAKSR